MGITNVPPHIAEKIADPTEKKRLGKAAWTVAESEAKYAQGYERDHQKRVVRLCQQNGLDVGWAGTHKRSTYTEGWPDLSIPYGPWALYIELKADGRKLSPTQRKLHDRFKAKGTAIHICYSDLSAWTLIKNWIRMHNPDWKPEHNEL
jgi:hypothetical protein